MEGARAVAASTPIAKLPRAVTDALFADLPTLPDWLALLRKRLGAFDPVGAGVQSSDRRLSLTRLLASVQSRIELVDVEGTRIEEAADDRTHDRLPRPDTRLALIQDATSVTGMPRC